MTTPAQDAPQRLAARDPSTPADTLAQLATDGAEWVRCAVAGNPSPPADTLARLASDRDEGVREAAAQPRS